MLLSVRIEHVNAHVAKASKKTKRFIVMRCDTCGTTFERKYQRAYMCDSICCSRSCAAQYRERVLPEASRANRSALLSEATARKNRSYWAALSPMQRDGLRHKISVGTTTAMASIDPGLRSRLNAAMSKSSRHRWATKHDQIIDSWRVTMRFRGTDPISGPERRLCSMLRDAFGYDDVTTQELVGGRRIDLFVRSEATYIQVDGIYWHGIGCDPATLIASGIRRDAKRALTIMADKRQNEWFDANGLKLIRVTDAWAKRASINEARDLVLRAE